MRIIGAEMMSRDQIAFEVKRGGRFVQYHYAVSAILFTFRNLSDIYFIPPDGSSVKNGLKYSALSLLVGWWGIPFGPIMTPSAILINFRGGVDVTEKIIGGLFPMPDDKGVMPIDVICPYCWTELKIDDKVRLEHRFVCARCRRMTDYLK